MKSLKTKLEAPLCSKIKDCEKRQYCDGRGTMHIGIFNDIPIGCWEYRRMKKEKNNWMIATIILGILICGYLVYDFTDKEKIISLGDFRIAEKDLQSFGEIMLNNNKTQIQVCNIKTRDCVILGS